MNAFSKICSLIHFTKLHLLVFFIFYNLMHGTEHINVLKILDDGQSKKKERLCQSDALAYFARHIQWTRVPGP